MPGLLLAPMRFLAALKLLAGKRLVPTALDTTQLQELDASIRRQALFSARMTQLHALQTLQDGLKGMLEGKDNLATAKLKMTQMYRALGYDAEAGGFPQDASGTVPPARKGSLKDLASDKRMTLTITTNYRVAANQVFTAKGLEERRLHQWPAWELVRIGRVRTPRGFKRRKGGAMEPVPGDDWNARWKAAGGECFDKGTRMIAPKTSDVWQKLGDGVGGYKDTLGNPFAPFAFGSKYGVREVARDTCLLLGVIEPDEQLAKPGPSPVQAAQCKASAAGLDPALIAAMKRDLAKQEDGSLRLQRQLDLELKKADEAYRARNSVRNRVWLHDVIANSGTRLGALLGWITRHKGKELAADAFDHTHPKGRFMRGKARVGKKLPYKRIDSAEAARIKAATGHDVEGRFHILEDEHVRHVHRHHGSVKTEAARGQHAVRREHFERLHELHSSEHSITTDEGIDPKSKLPRIKTSGRVGRRRYEHIEEIHPDYLKTVTLHIHNREGAAVADAPAKATPTERPKTSAAMDEHTSLRNRCKALVDAMERRET